MSYAHQVFHVRDQEALPEGDGVTVARHLLPQAEVGCDVVFHQRGTEDHRTGTVVALDKREGEDVVVVQFED